MKRLLAKLKLFISFLVVLVIITTTIGIVALNESLVSVDIAVLQFHDVLLGHSLIVAFLTGVVSCLAIVLLSGFNNKFEQHKLRRKISRLESKDRGN